MTTNLALPTDAQYRNFAEHLCDAHSWYKHIPLFEGAEFIFFLSESAGGNYSPAQPRLHHTWKTSAEYRHKFGYLDYMYRLGDEEYFSRDSVPIFVGSLPVIGGRISSIDNIKPPNLDACTAILYPYVACYGSGEVLCYLIQEEYLARLEIPGSHPDRDKILAWFQQYDRHEYLWQLLSDRERDLVFAISDREGQSLEDNQLPHQAIEYITQAEVANRLYRELQSGERAKIDRALANLEALSLQGYPVWY